METTKDKKKVVHNIYALADLWNEDFDQVIGSNFIILCIRCALHIVAGRNGSAGRPYINNNNVKLINEPDFADFFVATNLNVEWEGGGEMRDS